MKPTILKLLCAVGILFLTGCNSADEDFYENPKYIYEFANASGCDITICMTDKCGNLPNVFTIKNGKSYKWVNNTPKYYYSWFPFDAGGNPILIEYGKEATVDATLLPINRQLMKESNWTQKKDADSGENIYISTYTFTTEDYSWAIDNNVGQEE